MRHYLIIGSRIGLAVGLRLMSSLWDRANVTHLRRQWVTRDRLLDERPVTRERKDILQRRARSGDVPH